MHIGVAGVPAKLAVFYQMHDETLNIPLIDLIGTAGQYVYARDERVYYNKLCQFFETELIGDPDVAIDADHQAVWMPVEQAAATLSQEAHRWAVAKIVNSQLPITLNKKG